MTDPLLNPRLTEAQERELFIRVVQTLAGVPQDYVAHVALMLLVNCIRQTAPNRTSALEGFDALSAHCRRMLDDQYAANGRKRGVYAYDQVVHVPQVDLRGTRH